MRRRRVSAVMGLANRSMLRRGWIVPLCVVVVAIVAVIVAGAQTTYYRTEAVLVVPPSGGPDNTTHTAPGVLATTYAELIAQDDQVVGAAARATGLPPSVVRGRISATQSPNTSIIDVSFSDVDPRRSARGAAAIVAAVTGSNPVSPSIRAGALQLVTAPGAPFKQHPKVPGGPLPVGIVLGLILGIVLLIAWERYDRRADTAAILEAELGLPVTELEATGDGSVEALRRRWRVLCNGRSPARVALVAATLGSPAAAREAGERLAAAGGANDLELRATAAAGGDGELVAMAADLVVLVAARGDPVREIQATADALRKLGAEPRWTILTGAAQ